MSDQETIDGILLMIKAHIHRARMYRMPITKEVQDAFRAVLKIQCSLNNKGF